MELLVFIPLLLIGLIGSIMERWSWNGGVCRDNQLPWVHFDNDSQGGRGYKAGDNTIWVSYPGID